jgi:hypothetical protein
LFAASKEPPHKPAKAHGPYAKDALNRIYELLFCDDASLFRPKPETELSGWQSILFNSQPDPVAVRGVAEDQTQESRVRMLAFNWLRQRRLQVPKKELLGVIVECPIYDGLVVIAAYLDGRIRYINRTGRLVAFEAIPETVADQARKLLAASRTAIGPIGPWDRARLPPPPNGNIRLTFLVSDGLYFGEGPVTMMQLDPMGATVIREARKLEDCVLDAVQKGKDAQGPAATVYK